MIKNFFITALRGAGALATGVALLTISIQTLKAASANPAKNLRID